MRLGPKGWGSAVVSWGSVAVMVAVVVVGCKPREQGGTHGADTTKTTPNPRQALAGVGGTCIDTAAVRRLGNTADWGTDTTGVEGEPEEGQKARIIPVAKTEADSTRPLAEGWLLGRLSHVSGGPIKQAALGKQEHSYYWVQDCGDALGGRVAALVSKEETGYRIYRLEVGDDRHAPGQRVGWTERNWPRPIAWGGSVNGVDEQPDTTAVRDTTTAVRAYVTCAACSSGSWCRPS